MTFTFAPAKKWIPTTTTEINLRPNAAWNGAILIKGVGLLPVDMAECGGSYGYSITLGLSVEGLRSR